MHKLKYRRHQGDMIKLFKIIKGIYDHACVPHFDFIEISENTIRTRGNRYKLLQNGLSNLCRDAVTTP